MKPRWPALPAMVAFLAFVPGSWAQQPAPHIGYVYPAGGQQGTTVQVTIGGQYLEGAAQVYVSGGGVRAEVTEYIKPITQQQFNRLRDRLKELRNKPKDDEVLKELGEIQKKAVTFIKRANPAIAENVTVRFTVTPDAEPGQRELRVVAASGLSNPLAFHVGPLPEFTEKPSPPRRDPRTGKLLPRELIKREWGLDIGPDQSEKEISLPTVVNGQIMPGEADRYRFHASKGLQLVVAAYARQLIPYLADAVPGWFQATVVLYDPQGNEVAYTDDWRFHPDPVLFYKIPQDGAYVLEIKDALYRGREDFVYRVNLSEQPFVTSVFPPGGPAGGQTTVELRGGNLPVKQLTIDTKGKAPGVYPITVSSEKQLSNTLSFAVDTLPECLEQEPNNEPASAQPVMFPTIISGRVDRPGDWDVFCFHGQAGQKIVAAVDARRLGSPMDSLLRLTNAAGEQLAFNDDHEDKGDGLSTHHADSLLAATLPSDGTYYVHLGDVQRQGGGPWVYRLRISPPRPDFELRVVPSSISVRAGMSASITVYALRKDGFSGEIALALKGAPKQYTLSGAWVPANQDQVRLTLSAPPTQGETPLSLRLEGRATIEGRPTRRLAVPADDMMQAFAYHHLVPAKDWLLAILRPEPGRARGPAQGRGRGPAQSAPMVTLVGQQPVRLPLNGTATVQFSVPRVPIIDRVQLALSDPPEGIAIQEVSRHPDSVTIRLHADAGKVKPGLKGNLIVDAFLEKQPPPKDGKPRMNQARTRLGTLPAIPFEVVAQR